MRSIRGSSMNLVWLLLVLVGVSAGFGVQEKQPAPYKEVKPKPGERCVVCDALLGPDDVTYIVRGRRVPLRRAMVDSFMKHQELFFSKLQPKGALVQEDFNAPAGVALGGISFGWFLVGLYVLAGLGFGGLCAYAAVSRGLNGSRYFFVGLFLNVFGYVYTLTRPAGAAASVVPGGLRKVPRTHAPVVCPECGSENHPAAEKCSGCGAKLQPVYRSEVKKTGSSDTGE